MTNQITIIGISGIPGSGKTDLVRALSNSLQATAVHWNDFNKVSKGPQDYLQWYQEGHDYNTWDYLSLATVLKALKENRTITHPVSQEKLNPTKYIVFDAPLGRLHAQTAQFVDIFIHLDTPLDIALARKIIRNFSESSKTKRNILDELETYLTHSRKLFSGDEIKNASNLIIDGSLTIDKQVKKILTHLENNSPQI